MAMTKAASPLERVVGLLDQERWAADSLVPLVAVCSSFPCRAVAE